MTLEVQKTPKSTVERRTKELIRQIFRNHKENGKSSEDLSKAMGRAFQDFRSEYQGISGQKRDIPEKNKNIQERIATLQKRTNETLQVITNCKKTVDSVTVLDTRTDFSEDHDVPVSTDPRSLRELTEELRKIQNREPCSSFLSLPERPDIDDMKNATKTLLEDLDRISKNYSMKNGSESSTNRGNLSWDSPEDGTATRREI